MIKYYLNNGVCLSYLSNHLVVPVHEKGLLDLIMEYPSMWSDILEGRAHQVKRAHVAKYVFLATQPRRYGPAFDNTTVCIASVLKFAMQLAVKEDASCFVIVRNKLMSREIFRHLEM